MPFPPVWILGAAGAVLLLAIRYALVKISRGYQRLPPGPKGYPFIGNALEFPTTDQAKVFKAKFSHYGDMTHFNVLGQHVIVLNGLQAAKDLLDKRSATNSDRPDFVMGELVGFYDWSGGAMHYGPTWRTHRRVFHQALTPTALARYDDARLTITHDFLRKLLQSPNAFLHHAESSFTATALRIAYGIDFEPADEEYYVNGMRMLIDVGNQIGAPGRYLVEVIPALKYLPTWLPGAGFKREAEDIKRKLNDLVGSMYQKGKVQTVGKDSVVTDELSRASDLEGAAAAEAEAVTAGVAATIYFAGAETTGFSVQAFFLAMALHPEVQKKARAELDAVIGRARLPDFSDRESLPYITAIARELVRWHVVAPTGLAHQAMQEDEYAGYTIPKGTVLMPNAWAYSRDPKVYPDPERFMPERYLRDGKFAPNEANDPHVWAFGFGRRVCPGRHLADTTIFLICASVLHAFEISAKGPLEAKVVTTGNTSRPAEFSCEIKPRWDGAASLIMSVNA